MTFKLPVAFKAHIQKQAKKRKKTPSCLIKELIKYGTDYKGEV
jgi:hypothetical protein